MNTMIKYLLAICLFAALPFSSLMAQEKQLTLQELTPGGRNYSRFVPQNLKQLQWCGNEYIYVKGDSLLSAIPGKSERVAFTREQLNKALSTAGLQTVSSLPVFSLPDKNEPILSFISRQRRVHYNFKENKVVANYSLNSNWKNFDYCSSNGYLAFTEGNNIKILSPENNVTVVTNETGENIVCGQSVHQREFGIEKGIFWSPQGSSIAFYRMDESMVTTYPLVNIDARCAELVPIKYPMAGMKSHEVTVGIYNLSSGNTVWLKTGLPKEKYLTNIAWSPDEKSIYVAELNRDQNEMHMVRYSALTGEKEAVLFTETNDRYVEPQHPIQFLPNDPSKFIWQSDRDGFNHLYLYDTTGKLIKQLTSGEWVVKSVLGITPKGDQVFISATAPHPIKANNIGTPMEVYAWRVDIKSGERTCFTFKMGVHTVSVSPNGLYAIDNLSNATTPRDIEVVRTKDGMVINQLLSAKDPFRGYTIPAVETGIIKAADGVTDLHYRLLKPIDLDETKKYPTVVYVYGGPHSQLVTGSWRHGSSGWEAYMAQRGYVVFVVDNRGTNNRGRAFEDIIHRNLGVTEMADQMKGVEFLKSLPYVDADRIGVHGWSYGGFMTTNLMLTHPDVFKVGVAGGPVIDWSNYEIMYGERYMDRPQDNPEGYKNSNLKLRAGNLKGRLLMIHGDIDPVVVWQHSLGFLKACVDANTYPDYFVYPRHEHNMLGKDRVHLHEKITRYFDDNL